MKLGEKVEISPELPHSMDFHEILSIIEPGQTPVAYFDETRYLNF